VALSFIASSAWVSSTAAVTPGIPAGTTAGDYVVICLVSKYEDALLGGAPAGWTDLGTAINATRTVGNDNGGMRGRLFGRLWQSADTMPSLAPTPNNVSTTHATTYRVAAGQGFAVEAAGCVDDVVGSPLLLTAGTTLGLASGDLLHVEAVLNGDAPTFGTGTLTATGATFGAVATNTADLATATGTDMRMRSVRYSVTAGTATDAPSLSTALAGTTTNAVGVGFLLRLREVTPPVLPKTATLTDDFTGALDMTKWPAAKGGAANSNGRGTVPTITTAYPGYQTAANSYSLIDSSMALEVPVVPNAGLGTINAILTFWTPGGQVQVYWENNFLKLREEIAGVQSDVNVAYNAVTHRWWRIRHVAATNVLSWETSPDGLEWTIRRSKTPGFALGSGQVEILAGYYGTEAFPGTFEFDNFNVAPAPSSIVANLVSQTRTRISRVAGFDQTDVVWSSNMAFTGYQFRVVAAGTDPVTAGVQVELNQNPASGGAAATQYTSILTDDEIEAVSPAEGAKVVKLFIQGTTGEWSA